MAPQVQDGTIYAAATPNLPKDTDGAGSLAFPLDPPGMSALHPGRPHGSSSCFSTIEMLALRKNGKIGSESNQTEAD
jgi:hypothetical protein